MRGLAVAFSCPTGTKDIPRVLRCPQGNMSGKSLFALLLVALLCFAIPTYVRGEGEWEYGYADDDMDDERSFADDVCSSHTNCTACALTEGCGWCPAVRGCLSGSVNGSVDGSCNATHGWHFNATECRNCSEYTDCKSCVTAFSNTSGTVCGWCESFNATTNSTGNATCLEGNAAGPFYNSQSWETCAAKKWGVSSDFCDDSDDEKRKLAIIIGLSVAGGLFVFAVLATILFVIIKRAQRARGYQAINESA